MLRLPENLPRLRVVAAPHPFREAREILHLRPGQTLAQLLAEVQPNPGRRQAALIWVAGRPVPRDLWAITIPRPDQLTVIRVIPQDRGVAMVFVAIAAIVASVLVMGYCQFLPLAGFWPV